MKFATIARTLATLALGLSGGVLFQHYSLPLPWMLGAMCATAAAAVVGIPVVSAKKVRPPFAAVIGIALGASIQPIGVTQAIAWLPVTIALLVSTPLIGAIGYFYFTRAAGFDRTTAYFAAMPGGVYEMTSQGGLAGGDEKRIALAQAVRIFIVVFTVPFVFDLYFSFGPTVGMPETLSGHSLSLVGTVTQMLLVGLSGWGLAKMLRFPNPPLLGPLLMTAICQLLDLADPTPPYMLVAAAQVIIGTSIGGQFIGMDRRQLFTSVGHGLMVIPAMLMTGAAIAALAMLFTDTHYAAIMLALAPGGTAELSLVAMAINVEVAGVILHQVFRILLIYSFAAAIFRLRS